MALSPRGPRNATPDTWRRCVALAEEADLRLHTHVNENQAQADLLGASPEGRDLEALASWGALSPRLVMAHAVWLSDHERDLARRHRPHVCHCPSANLKLASGFAPVPGYLADGLAIYAPGDRTLFDALGRHLTSTASSTATMVVEKPGRVVVARFSQPGLLPTAGADESAGLDRMEAAMDRQSEAESRTQQAALLARTHVA